MFGNLIDQTCSKAADFSTTASSTTNWIQYGFIWHGMVWYGISWHLCLCIDIKYISHEKWAPIRGEQKTETIRKVAHASIPDPNRNNIRIIYFIVNCSHLCTTKVSVLFQFLLSSVEATLYRHALNTLNLYPATT